MAEVSSRACSPVVTEQGSGTVVRQMRSGGIVPRHSVVLYYYHKKIYTMP